MFSFAERMICWLFALSYLWWLGCTCWLGGNFYRWCVSARHQTAQELLHMATERSKLLDATVAYGQVTIPRHSAPQIWWLPQSNPWKSPCLRRRGHHCTISAQPVTAPLCYSYLGHSEQQTIHSLHHDQPVATTNHHLRTVLAVFFTHDLCLFYND